MKKSYPFWVLFSLGLFVGAVITAGTTVQTFMHIPSFIAVVFPPSFLIVAGFGLRGFGRSFRIAFEGVAATRQEMETGVRLFDAMLRYLLLTGVITMMIGFVAILANLSGAGELVGTYVALALITMFYALMLIFTVAVPFKTALQKRLIED